MHIIVYCGTGVCQPLYSGSGMGPKRIYPKVIFTEGVNSYGSSDLGSKVLSLYILSILLHLLRGPSVLEIYLDP